jgi:hypothetical protein
MWIWPTPSGAGAGRTISNEVIGDHVGQVSPARSSA